MKTKSPALSGKLADAELRTLRIFMAVVQHSGFTPAALELNISRSAVSIAIADLEKRLSLRLCERGRAGFSLTTEGQEVYRSTRQLLSALDEFRSQINAIHFNLKGELNIGITDNLVTMPQMRITSALRELNRLGPDVQINIQMIPPNEIVSGVLDGHLHTGVIPVLKNYDGLEYLPLYEERSSLYCSQEHELFCRHDRELSPSMLKQYSAVLPAYEQTVEIKALHHDLQPSASATDREGVAFLILTGRYIGYLPDHYAHRWVKEGAMRAIMPAHMSYLTPFATITKKSAASNLVLDNFLEQLQQAGTTAGG
ncbi:MAG: LysR family transcriptional regulator [Colwellia sp.]|uniref:LysR family transcriptional regulator n=1 Tax=Colwellia sp. TaxID=56799 RepID=UPI0025C58FA9|nr:LysR family transcriptional regulator [Colwellia sp.]NQZ28289.1 LysR family transcriptional regulator [Colwellia sp.]